MGYTACLFMHALRPQDSTNCLDIGYEVNKRYYNFFFIFPFYLFSFSSCFEIQKEDLRSLVHPFLLDSFAFHA